jgi:hypothetical protein
VIVRSFGCGLGKGLGIGLTLAGIGAIATPAFAQGQATAQTFEGARLLGLAEAQRALTSQNDSIYLNPAGLAMGSIYSVELGAFDDLHGSDRRFNASIVDSQAGPIAGGLAYTYTKRRPEDWASLDDQLRYHRFDVALATKVADTAAIGITGRYLIFNRSSSDPTLDGQGFNVLTLDAGVQWHVVQGLALGIAGYNLTNSSHPEVPISFGGGLGYAIGAFSIEGDLRYNAKVGKALYSAGAGYVLADTVPLRAGVAYDAMTQSVSISAGLGFIVDRFAIDLGFRQRLTGTTGVGEDQPRIFGVALRGAFL